MSEPSTKNPIRIAVFGDTHGHLRLMFQLCRLWQLDNGVHLDAVLQCGDLGFFPTLGNIDKATRSFAQRDPEELAFARFFAQPLPLEEDALLNRTLLGAPDDLNTVRCPVLWCEGNHEDFEALRELVGTRALVPVDAFGVFHYLQPGRIAEVTVLDVPTFVPGFERYTRVWEHEKRTGIICPRGIEAVSPHVPSVPSDGDSDTSHTLRIAAVGGGYERKQSGRGDREGWGWVSEKSCQRLMGRAFDVFVTHCGPSGVQGTLGSPLLRAVIDSAQPSYHFYAHHSEHIEPTQIGETSCVWFNDVNFERAQRGMYPYGHLEPNCMGLLSWEGPDSHSFDFVTDSWFDEVTWAEWKKM